MSVRRVVRWLTVVAALSIPLPLLALTAPAEAKPKPPGSLPPGLRPTELNVSNDPAQRYGESQIAVNPTNPDNLVYMSLTDRFTLGCQAQHDPNCDVLPATLIGLGFTVPTPRGYFDVPGFAHNSIFVSFNHGNSWQSVELPPFPPDHPDLDVQGDPSITVGPDGTFYASWDDINWGEPSAALPDGGIAVSKSTDGGLTWSGPVLAGTALDGPKITADPNTGRVYEVSTGAIGRLATGNPSDPIALPGFPSDRYVVASSDGVNWTTPRRFGGGGDPGFSASGVPAAAYGVLATAFRSTSSAACNFFVGGSAPCVVFQTTTDDGATWSRHNVPAPDLAPPAGIAGAVGVSVAADPTTPGHFTIAGLNSSGKQYVVYQTRDSGAHWTGPTTVTDSGPAFTKFQTWLNYSSSGVLGMVWRARTASGTNAPYAPWAAVSDDGGATFKTPLQVSAEASPPPPPSNPFNAPADDYSNVAVGADRLWVSWADWRPGERQAYFGEVKLEAFDHAS